MVNYVDMYAQILDRLVLDVIEHACKITPTVLDIWTRIPICSLTPYNELMIFTNTITIQPTRLDERVAITVTTDIGISSTNTYLWEEDEVEDLIYSLLPKELSECLTNDSLVHDTLINIQNLHTALAYDICRIISKYATAGGNYK